MGDKLTRMAIEWCRAYNHWSSLVSSDRGPRTLSVARHRPGISRITWARVILAIPKTQDVEYIPSETQKIDVV
jgi:hypothetical protein